MKLSNLKTVDELEDRVYYIKYIDEDEKVKQNKKNPEYIIRKIIDHSTTPKTYKYIMHLGAYLKWFERQADTTISNKYVWFFRGDIGKTIQMETSDKTRNYQSVEDFKKDFGKSQDIQENVLSNTMARGIFKGMLGTDAAASEILKFLPHATETNYVTGENEYIPIFENKKLFSNPPKSEYHDKKLENILKWQKKWPRTLSHNKKLQDKWPTQLRIKPKSNKQISNSLPNRNKKEEWKEEDLIEEKSDSLPKIQDDIIPNTPHNKTQRKTSTLRSIFSDWYKSRSKSRVHVEKGGKRKTRKNKNKKRKTRKNHKKTNLTKKKN